MTAYMRKKLAAAALEAPDALESLLSPYLRKKLAGMTAATVAAATAPAPPAPVLAGKKAGARRPALAQLSWNQLHAARGSNSNSNTRAAGTTASGRGPKHGAKEAVDQEEQEDDVGTGLRLVNVSRSRVLCQSM
jgi:hypothetical protein